MSYNNKCAYKAIGKLKDRSDFKSGTSERGFWRIVRFSIERTRRKKKILLVFTAKGSNADLVNKIVKGEKMIVYFYPECKKVNDKIFTELIAEKVEKYLSPNDRMIASLEHEVEFRPSTEFDEEDNELQFPT